MSKILFVLVTVTSARIALADTTYQVDPSSTLEEPPTSQRCGESTRDSLNNIVKVLSHIKLTADGVFYKLSYNDSFSKATRSLDNYGWVDKDDSSIVLAVLQTSAMDRPHADRSKVMIGVIKRGKRPCAERWFGFAKVVSK